MQYKTCKRQLGCIQEIADSKKLNLINHKSIAYFKRFKIWNDKLLLCLHISSVYVASFSAIAFVGFNWSWLKDLLSSLQALPLTR